jgi:hypothetical protein
VLSAQEEAGGARAAYRAGLDIAHRLEEADPASASRRELALHLAAKLAACCQPPATAGISADREKSRR